MTKIGQRAFLRGQADRVDLRLRAARPIIDQFQTGEADPARLHHLLTQALAVPPFAGGPVWIHGDLHRANLWTQRARLCAVIDWGGMGPGDPGMDLMVAWARGPRRCGKPCGGHPRIASLAGIRVMSRLKCG